MAYCDCACAREVDDRRAAVRMLANDITDATWSNHP
jgi:hypothetical protein